MLANWIKETTVTTGTGTITLAGAETGFVAFADQFLDGAKVYYMIADGNNRESGIGTFTASGTTLSRDTIIETLVSGVLNATSPTAITLSGSAVVMISADAASDIVNIWSGRYSALSASYKYFTAYGMTTGANTLVLNTTTLYVTPVLIPAGATVTGLYLYVQTAAVGNAVMGIAEINPLDLEIGTELLETAAFSMNATGVQGNTVTSTYFPKTKMVYVWLSSAAAATIRKVNASMYTPYSAISSSGEFQGVNSGSGAVATPPELPATHPTLDTPASTGIPKVLVSYT